jgi:hypothetical protein
MEATVKTTTKMTSHDSADLIKGIETALDTILEKVTEEDWNLPAISIDDKNLTARVIHMTLNQRKKLKNKINGCVHKKSLRAINTFLHFLHKHVLEEKTPAPEVRISEKEVKIQAARKKYVEARNIAMKLYKEYKEEKGDFYKKKMAK